MDEAPPNYLKPCRHELWSKAVRLLDACKCEVSVEKVIPAIAAVESADNAPDQPK